MFGGYRLQVASRAVAAVLGGYALANMGALAVAGALSSTRAEIVMTAGLLSFAIYTAAVMWAFAARSASRAWAGIALLAAISGLVLAAQGVWP